MTNLPSGFTARPLDPTADLAIVVELCTQAAVAEYGVPDADERMIRESYAARGFEAARDTLLILDADGVAAGLAEYYDNENEHVSAFCYLRVRPDLLDPPHGVGEALQAWAVKRGAGTVALAAPGNRVAIIASVAGVNQPMQQLHERCGWRLDRHYLTMEIDLAAAPTPDPAWPDGISVRHADLDRDAAAVHTAENDAFADHYGFLPSSFEDWWHFRTRLFEAEPDLWFLAVDGGEIAAFAICLSRRPGEPDLGWVSTLGVRRAWRRKGLGLALLHHAFRELAARGSLRVGLGVDAQSLTGATRLYERAGMKAVRESRAYEFLLRDGRDLRTTDLLPPA